MSFETFDPIEQVQAVQRQERKRRKGRSAIPEFTGDIDLDSLSKGVPFPSPADFGKRATQDVLLGQRGRVERTPLRLQAERQIENAFLTDPLTAPVIDPSRKNGRRRKQSKRDKGRSSILKERERLKRGGARRSSRQAEDFSELDTSFRSLGL